MRRFSFGAGGAIVIYLLLLPVVSEVDDAELFTYTLMFTSVGIAISWNLTGGFTGYVDFGHAVWFGIGAYGTAVMMSAQSEWFPQEWPLIPSLLVGSLLSGLTANLIGRLTMRLSGAYFSIAMLGFFVFMREVVRVAGPVTNRGVGLTIEPQIDRPLWYYIELSFVLTLIVLSWWLRRTLFGATLIAIREDEVGAEMRGINTTRNKVTVFTCSGFITGLLGGMWAYQNTFVEPDIAFWELRTVEAIMGTMLGGIGTVMGPILGSSFLFWLRELLWSTPALLDTHLLVQGFLLALVVLYLPKGLVGLLRGEAEYFDRFRPQTTIFDDELASNAESAQRDHDVLSSSDGTEDSVGGRSPEVSTRG